MTSITVKERQGEARKGERDDKGPGVGSGSSVPFLAFISRFRIGGENANFNKFD